MTRGRPVVASAAAVAALLAAPSSTLHGQALTPAEELARQAVVRRTVHGVPHIRAESLEAGYYAMGYVQTEDYGLRVPGGLVAARGELTRWLGRDTVVEQLGFAGVRRDAMARLEWDHAVRSWERLPEDVRAAYRGFAAGVNRYVELHPEEFPDWMEPDFSAYDVLARDVSLTTPDDGRGFMERWLDRREEEGAGDGLIRAAGGAVGGGATAVAREATAELLPPHAEPGSNAWALAPERTESGHAILVRNPHLSWGAGYYEAHMRVPGVLDFYGDFRLGGPFGIIGGFNRRLGFATTNNYHDQDEVYALDADPERGDHYLLDGASLPLERRTVTVTFRNGPGTGTETVEVWRTALGPVVHRGLGKVFVLREPGDGEYRLGEQFLRMMRASSLEEWKEAMRMQARTASNFTYADADGNIFYVSNWKPPHRPHPPGGDTAVVAASTTDDVFTRFVPWDSLPMLANPEGGYLHNENDPFHYANLNEVIDPADFPPDFPEPRLRLRSQHSLELIGGTDVLSLEEVVRRKHSMRMLLADRVKTDLLRAVRAELRAGAAASGPEPDGSGPTDAGPGDAEVAAAADLLEAWDNTVARDSRGGVLFRTWWWRYLETAPGAEGAEATPASAGFAAPAGELFAEPWRPEAPVTTPRGLADPDRAAEAFRWAVGETEERHGGWDVAWGEVHRARIGDVDLPVGGCTGLLGCFRVLWYVEDDDGKLRVRGGDGWVFAVEFGEVPRAYSILAYGQSTREGSPHSTDQLGMFASHEMKPVAFTEEAIREATVREYRPGLRAGGGGR